MSMEEGRCVIAKRSLMLWAVTQLMQWKQGGEKIQVYQGSEVVFEY